MVVAKKIFKKLKPVKMVFDENGIKFEFQILRINRAYVELPHHIE